MSYLWRAIDALATCPVSGDEIHLVADQHYRLVAETGARVAISTGEAAAEISAMAETTATVAARNAAEDAARAEAAASADDAIAAALRASFPAITDAAVETFVRRYASGWTVEAGYGLYDGYGDGADQRLAKLVAACVRDA